MTSNSEQELPSSPTLLPKGRRELIGLDDWLCFLENRHSQEIQLGLTRVTEAARELNLLTPKARVITVAGTNGKGSTVALLESIYSAAGYKVASYTSPHVLSFTERIKVKQRPISEPELLTAFDAVSKSSQFNKLTYFEVATLAALWHFSQQPLDLIILEVGLGGRLDATNIIAADLAIITSIDLDHQAYLGNTREAIGYEKAGILRAKKPYVYADLDMPETILNHATQLAAKGFRRGVDYDYELSREGMLWHYQEQPCLVPHSPWHPNNVAASMMAVHCLQDVLPLEALAWRQGIQAAALSGRQQLINTEKMSVLLDVAHNPEAVRHLVSYLSKNHAEKHIHAVFSALADKDIPGLILPLKPYVATWHLAPLANKRAASRAQLEDAIKSCDVKTAFCYNELILAFQAACAQARASDLVMVYGSFFTVSMILPLV